jgi:hypothetical protein
MFAPPESQDYAIRQDAREGIFFTYDRTFWAFTPPQAKPILTDALMPVYPISPVSIAQLNNNFIEAGVPGSSVYVYGSDPLSLDLNTNWMRTQMQWGNRFEGGWIYDDYGMLFNYSQSGPQSQAFVTTNAFAVNSPFTEYSTEIATGEGTDGGIGEAVVVATITATSGPPDHMITQSLTQRNSTEMTSAGFAWAVRRNLSKAGSGELRTMRFTFGPKYMQVADRYSIDYVSTTQSYIDGCPQGDICQMQNGGWDTSAYNNIVGPEIGLNYVVEKGRWSIETDLRFIAGMNWQNTLYRGSNFPASLGADYLRSTLTFADTVPVSNTDSVTQLDGPPLFVQIFGVGQTNATNAAEHNFVFAPLGEWRLRGRYRVSKAVSLNLGYTGMWLGSITRASTNTAYVQKERPVVTAQYDEEQDKWIPTNRAEVPRATTLRTYNSIGPSPGNDLGYLFVNGVDFGIEINY